MKHIAGVSLALFSLMACGDNAEPEPEPQPQQAWPCGSQRGDVRSTYEYDARHRVTHQLDVRGDGTPLHEVSTAFTGDLEARVEETTYATDPLDVDQVDVTERTLAGGRVSQVRFTSTQSMNYVEDWRYQPTGELSETRATLANGMVFQREFSFPEPGVEVALQRWEGSSNASLRIRHGGALWTRELVDGSTDTRHDRWFDANGLLVAEETFETADAGEQRLIRRDITRRADGAPLSEVLVTAAGRAETTYLFACTP